MGQEYELKFAADEQTLAAIREAYPGPWRRIEMETVYYDTPDGSVTERHWTLRRRLENGVSVCTLKTPGTGGLRGEWETERDRIEDALPILCKLGAPEVRPPVRPVCGVRFVRQALEIAWQGGVVELALDAGTFEGGGRRQVFAEAEVELRSGPASAADGFARMLAERFGLSEEPRSKFQRARALVRD